jgi:hypothetical protein
VRTKAVKLRLFPTTPDRPADYPAKRRSQLPSQPLPHSSAQSLLEPSFFDSPSDEAKMKVGAASQALKPRAAENRLALL